MKKSVDFSFVANYLVVLQTWKEEMQYVYSGKAMFAEEVES